LITDNPPIVQRLEWSQEDQDYINSMLEGKLSEQVVNWWKKCGHDIERRNKYYVPPQLKERKRALSHKYHISMCCMCHNFPTYKIIYKLDGISLVEYYCDSHSYT
jgi:hypothetical protein